MALIVNGVCRYSLVGFFIDRPWVNVLDFQIDTTGSTENRDDVIYNQAGNILNAWVDHLAQGISDECVLTSVDWVDLDSANGSTGSRIATSEYTLPDAGTVTDAPASGNVALLVTKATASARGARHGRMYRPGVTEVQTNGQEITPGMATSAKTQFDGFLSQVNTDSGIIGVGASARLVVVHTTGPNPQTGTYSPVTNLIVEPRLATQRRRLRG